MNKKILGLMLPAFVAAIFCATSAQAQVMTVEKYKSSPASLGDVMFGTNNSGYFPQSADTAQIIDTAISRNMIEKATKPKKTTSKYKYVIMGNGSNANVVKITEEVPVEEEVPTKKVAGKKTIVTGAGPNIGFTEIDVEDTVSEEVVLNKETQSDKSKRCTCKYYTPDPMTSVVTVVKCSHCLEKERENNKKAKKIILDRGLKEHNYTLTHFK